MPEIDETGLAVAEVYAEPLFALADDWNLTDTVREEFDDFVAYMEANADFAAFLTSPAIDDAQRGPALEKLFRGRMNDLLLDTLLVLNNRGRLPIVAAVRAAFQKRLDAQRKQVAAVATTATALTDAQRRQVTEAISRRTGKSVSLSERVDAGILGGIIVQVGDERIDGSMARSLERLRTLLHQRASQEVITLRDAAVEN